MNKKDFPFLILIFLLPWIIFYNFTLLKGFPYVTDPVFGYYPYFSGLWSAIRQGEIPFWNPYIGCGTTFFTEMGVFYPLHYLFIFLPSSLVYFLYTILFHYSMGGIFMYLFIKEMGVGKYGALLGAVSFMFSGFMVGHLVHPNIIESSAYLPLISYFILKYIKRLDLKYVVIAGILWGIQILPWHPQIPYLTGVFIFFFLLSNLKVLRYSVITSYIIFILLGLGTSAIFLLPVIKNMPEIFKISTYAQTTHLSYHFMNFSTLLYPSVYGKIFPWDYSYIIANEGIAYIGVIPFLLIPISFFLKDKRIIFWWVIVFLFAILAMGRHTIFYRIFYYLPFYKFTRTPVRAIFILTFALSVIASITFENLKKINRIKGIISVIAFLIVFNIAFLLPHIIPIIKNLEFIRYSMITLSIIILLLQKFKYLLTIHIIDIFIFVFFFNPIGNAKAITTPPDFMNLFDKDSRVLFYQANKGLNMNDVGKAIVPDMNMEYGIQGVTGYIDMPSKEYINGIVDHLSDIPQSPKILDFLNIRYIVVYSPSGYTFVDPLNPAITGMINNQTVKYINLLIELYGVSRKGIPPEDTLGYLEIVDSKDKKRTGYFLPAPNYGPFHKRQASYSFPVHPPKQIYYVTINYRKKLGELRILDAMYADMNNQLQKINFVPPVEALPYLKKIYDNRIVKVYKYAKYKPLPYKLKLTYNKIKILFSSEGKNYILPFHFSKGWHLNLDGRDIHPEKLGYYNSIVYIPSGIHKLNCYYIPPFLKSGMLITIITIIFSILLIYFSSTFKGTKQSKAICKVNARTD